MNGRFDWDNKKAAANWRDHGVSFNQAVKAFSDVFAVEKIDDREDYGEERINLLGMCDGVIFARDLHGTPRADQNHLSPAGRTT